VNEFTKRRKLNLTVVPVKTREEGLRRSRTARRTPMRATSWLLIGAGVKSKDPKSLFLLPEDLSFEPYAIALPRGDAGLGSR